MQTTTRDLDLRQFSAQALNWPEESLRDPSRVAVHFTELESLSGVSALVAAPRNHVFCSMPDSTFSRGRGHYRPEGQSAWQDWLDAVMLQDGVEKAYLKELRGSGLSAGNVRWGLLPYMGSTASVAKDVGFSKRLSPLWQQWFRCYLIPPNRESRSAFVSALESLFADRDGFAVRRFDDASIPPDVACHFDDNDNRQEALLWSYCFHPSTLQEQPAFSERAESGDLPSFDALSPAFNDWSANAAIAGVRPQSIGSLNAELITSYRIRLMRLTRWPVFCRLLSPVAERMRRRMAEFGPRPDSLPYDIAAEAESLVTEVKAEYPSYQGEPFDAALSLA
jgi:hypothetical protein